MAARARHASLGTHLGFSLQGDIIFGVITGPAVLHADANHSLSGKHPLPIMTFSGLCCATVCALGAGFVSPPIQHYLSVLETVGTGMVPIQLVAGTLGIGSHLHSLLLSALSETAVSPADRALQTALLSKLSPLRRKT